MKRCIKMSRPSKEPLGTSDLFCINYMDGSSQKFTAPTYSLVLIIIRVTEVESVVKC